ncbi:MAG TPA: YggS family pyridoxal phosphate-dependent enzyme [Planctomycetota bacterium]|nr:YggS family pyridoxal phosphate-dependent enzyme [Planctomycetota bacterium]
MTSSIAANLQAVRVRIARACERAGRSAGDVQLLAVSKTHAAAAVREAHAAGQRLFGENRVQELVAKAADTSLLPGLQWHLIGSLQTNKVGGLLRVPGLAMVHSLDRKRLADELQRELDRSGRKLPVLLQLHATDEASKHGCPMAAAPALLEHVQRHCPSLDLVGVMAMGPLAGDPGPAFARVAALRTRLRADSGLDLPVLSLGMSSDLEAAVAAGSTLVRIGTGVFGPRG